MNTNERVHTENNAHAIGFQIMNQPGAAGFTYSPEESEALLKCINTSSILATADTQGNILTVNDKLCEISQYDREECIGNSYNIFRHPDMPKSLFKDLWATISSGNVFRGKIKNKKKDGSPFFVDAVISPVLGDDGKPVKYLTVSYEITDEELEKQNMIGAHKAIDEAYAWVEFDLKGNITYGNNSFLSLMGYRADEVIGRHHRIFVDPAYTETPEYARFWEDLNSGKAFHDDFCRIAKDGSPVWIRAVYTPVKDNLNRVVKIIKLAIDITEQKKRELDLPLKVERILEVVDAAAKGDLTKEISVDGTEAIDKVCDGLKTFFGTLRSNIHAISKSAEILASSATELSAIGQEMSGNAEETSVQSNIVSVAAEQVSQNIQTVAAGAEELDASIKEIAKNSVDAAQVAMQAVGHTEEANLTMVKLGESSAEIGNVVKVITSIAQQTNLLALNATIEAARAGEAGKGFAVVANEVKELAKETARATENISRKIEAIQAATQDSMNAIVKISSIIKEINESQNTIASAVEEQSATTKEIGRNVSEAAKGGSEISENIMSVAKAAKETAEGASNNQLAASELSKMAVELQSIVSQFKC
ncbi:methyl-accepting chemotaxis protein [Legionella sp. CNM-4043-24]|uniref:methyl-accepting chemotaxis protein n=1 Tax=Legionella sp. CNM-4043-24 TaxID=3421646 RepID=UPI00403B26B6